MSLRRPPLPVASPALASPCLVLRVPGECALPESAAGYRAALAGVNASLLVLPAVLELPSDLRMLIANRLRHGGIVIVESGAGFAGHLDFRRHRRSLREVLSIAVAAPVDLWTRGASARGTPYVAYMWPHAAHIRDFSKVVPLADQRGEIIARVNDLPVALRRRVGAGTLIFLGSPLGPALWAGDPQARRWLQEVLS